MDWTGIIVLTLTGMVLIGIDFYLPGFVLASIGIVMMLVATGYCYNTYGLGPAVVMFIVEGALGIGAGYVSIKLVPQTRLGKQMFLQHTQEGQRAQAPLADDWIGKRGVAQTILRPSGMAVIEGKRVDVVAESGVIEPDSLIEVVAVNENRIVVRKT